MKLEIIYSDKSIAVVNKPAGMLSVPGRGTDKTECAVSEIRKIFPDCIEQPVVHRLDMDTSGLMVFGLTAEAHRNLSIQFQDASVKKKYIAVLERSLEQRLGEGGRIELKYRLDTGNRPKQVFDPLHGKAGITLWKLTGPDRRRVEFQPLTGRTHQLRLHAAHPVEIIDGKNAGGIGCPIAGDRLYGSSSDYEHETGTRMLLHASEIEFKHPETGRTESFKRNPLF